ncbi:aldo/keto reductase [Tessaracoccus antarcticus]|uniref:Aldo/keto reductase n=1 Tax=Tessaracoccus antarcticus TaxID=2479848 RepID=A0A3M0G9K2_9ACTN|nr:aldo/keto reductase [Tessaracoccus antarcticus]RMB61625.1 aldo/keto reductase [Tessaracoccus antarcticus]
MRDLRTLGHSGLLVSPLTLGTMTMANPGWGSDEKESGRILDRFLQAGGNAIDTADVYADGATEELLGRLISDRGIRDAVVIATKYGFGGGGGLVTGGAGRATMVRALEGSLRRLATDRIDLYWMHTWDGLTPASEVVQGMADLIAAGKVSHWGLSNTPAWFAAQAITLARAHGLPTPIALQLEYSLVARDIEREHVPAARELGMGVVPWSPLAGGFLTGKYRRDDPAAAAGGRLTKDNPFSDSKFTDHNWAVLDALAEVAEGVGRPAAEVATAWVLDRPAVDTVLVGARTLDQLNTSLAAAEHPLPSDARERLDAASAQDLGYPYDIFTPRMAANICGGGTPVHRLR